MLHTLTIADAYQYVRAVLDELDDSDDIGMTLLGNEDNDLKELVTEFLPEAVVVVHKVAPAHMLSGKQATSPLESIDGGMANLNIPERVLRVVYVKASDSDIYVTEVFKEGTPEARMQLNPFLRGRYDSPVVIERVDKTNISETEYIYYSLELEGNTDVTFEFEYIPYPTSVNNGVGIAPDLEYPVLNMLTSLVFAAYAEHDKAELYKKKSLEYIA